MIGVGAVQTGAVVPALIASVLFITIFMLALSLAWAVGLLACAKGGQVGRKLAGLGSPGRKPLQLHERRATLRVSHDAGKLPRA